MKSWKILVPTAEVKKPAIAVPSIPDLSGKVVGFVSNEMWVCLPPMWKKIAEILRLKCGVAETFKVAVPSSHAPPTQVFDEVATRSNAAIVALANWGSCTAWSVHAGMELIKRGVPTVVLVNEDFIGTAEAVAKSRGLSTLPYVVFPRTISIMPPEEVEAITEKAANKILALLKAGPQS